MAEAETVVGRLRATNWQQDADPLKAHVFALALHLVKAKVEPLITSILDAVRKHKTDEVPRQDQDVFVVELGGANSAASGVATPTFMNFPIDTTAISRLEDGVQAKAAEGSLTEPVMRGLVDAIRDGAETLAPTVIHEFTHMALNKMYRNDSNPWLSLKKARKLTGLGESVRPGTVTSATYAEVVKFANIDLRDSDLKSERAELQDFAEHAPLEALVTL